MKSLKISIRFFGVALALTKAVFEAQCQGIAPNDTLSIYLISSVGEIRYGEFQKRPYVASSFHSSLVESASKIYGDQIVVKGIEAGLSKEPREAVSPNLTEVYYPSKSNSETTRRPGSTAIFSDSAVFSNLSSCHCNYVMVYAFLWMYKNDEEHKRDEYKHSVYYGSWPRIYYGAAGTYVSTRVAVFEMSSRKIVYEHVYQDNFRYNISPEHPNFNSLLSRLNRKILRNVRNGIP